MAKTYEPIASTTLGATASFIDFSSITGAFTDLVLVANLIDSGVNDIPFLRFNSDSGSNYSVTFMYSDENGNGSSRYSSQTSMPLLWFGAGERMLYQVAIQSYANTSVNKTVLTQLSKTNTAVGRQVGLWRSTSAINAVRVGIPSGSFAVGSTFSLYGIKAA